LSSAPSWSQLRDGLCVRAAAGAGTPGRDLRKCARKHIGGPAPLQREPMGTLAVPAAQQTCGSLITGQASSWQQASVFSPTWCWWELLWVCRGRLAPARERGPLSGLVYRTLHQLGSGNVSCWPPSTRCYSRTLHGRAAEHGPVRRKHSTTRPSAATATTGRCAVSDEDRPALGPTWLTFGNYSLPGGMRALLSGGWM